MLKLKPPLEWNLYRWRILWCIAKVPMSYSIWLTILLSSKIPGLCFANCWVWSWRAYFMEIPGIKDSWHWWIKYIEGENTTVRSFSYLWPYMLYGACTFKTTLVIINVYHLFSGVLDTACVYFGRHTADRMCICGGEKAAVARMQQKCWFYFDKYDCTRNKGDLRIQIHSLPKKNPDSSVTSLVT